MKAQKKAIG